jgi:hypothetical protein
MNTKRQTSIYASDEFRKQETRATLKSIIDMLKSDPDLRNELHQILSPSGESPPAEVVVIEEIPVTLVPPVEPVLPVESLSPVLGLPAEAIADIAVAAVSPEIGDHLSVEALTPPQPSDTAESYIMNVVKPAGWDPITWATAVLAIVAWSWPADQVALVKAWAAETISDAEA